MKFKTTIPPYPEDGTPEMGARKMAGKSNMPDANVSPSLHPPVETAKEAEEVKGAARRAIDKQLRSDEVDGTTSSPKKRDASTWGTGFADSQNKKTLTK